MTRDSMLYWLLITITSAGTFGESGLFKNLEAAERKVAELKTDKIVLEEELAEYKIFMTKEISKYKAQIQKLKREK